MNKAAIITGLIASVIITVMYLDLRISVGLSLENIERNKLEISGIQSEINNMRSESDELRIEVSNIGKSKDGIIKCKTMVSEFTSRGQVSPCEGSGRVILISTSPFAKIRSGVIASIRKIGETEVADIEGETYRTIPLEDWR